jgi:hypothetical protein
LNSNAINSNIEITSCIPQFDDEILNIFKENSNINAGNSTYLYDNSEFFTNSNNTVANYKKGKQSSKNNLNNLGNSFNNRKASIISNNSNNDEEIENDSDEIIEGEFSYQKFSKLKQKIFQYIENNSAAKEKKKILSLIKTYKHKK